MKMEFGGVSSLIILGVLHRLTAFCYAQGRSWFERGAQRRTSGVRIVFVSDNVAPQSGQRGEQFFLLLLPDIEFIESFDKVFDQRVELASRHTHVLVRFFHA